MTFCETGLTFGFRVARMRLEEQPNRLYLLTLCESWPLRSISFHLVRSASVLQDVFLNKLQANRLIDETRMFALSRAQGRLW